MSSLNLTVANSPYRVDQHAAPRVPEGDNQPPAPIDPSVDKWFFISVHPKTFGVTNTPGICSLGECISGVSRIEGFAGRSSDTVCLEGIS